MIFKNVNYILLLFQAMERNCYIFCWIFKSEKDLSWKYVHKCYNPILSPFMNYHRIWNKNSTTRRVPLVEQEMLFLLEHMRSHLCVVFCTSLFVFFLLTFALPVLLRITTSDYLFGIFKKHLPQALVILADFYYSV